MATTKELIIESKIHGTYSTLVNENDWSNIKQHKWYLLPTPTKGKYYAATKIKIQEKITTITMHRLIMNTPKNKVTDHINGNTLDNRKENLRICTSAENQYNRGPQKNNTSGYKGVSWNKQDKKWRAAVKHFGKQIYLGSYNNKEEAAKAYDAKIKELHGKFARLNFPN